MNDRSLRRTTRLGISVLVLVILNSIALAASLAQQPPPKHAIYVPLVRQGDPPETVFGIEMASVTPQRGLDLVLTSGTKWIRRNALLWKDIEPIEGGGYNWDASSMQILEQEMINASQHDLNLILVVRASPRWATAPYEADCAPVNPEKYAAFANFLAAAVERYSYAPYNVKYWEIGNEPDAYIFPSDSVFGCWGVVDDPYYGGRAYGEALKTVSAAMKAVNSDIQILNGGLLLDRSYDPLNPEEGLSGRFLEGMLVAGAGSAFDILSFHGYLYFKSPGLPPLGPSEDWRIDYLNGLLKDYNVPPKPLIRSETGLLCMKVTPECRWAQASFLTRTFARSMRDQLLGNIWYVYDNDSYHNTALIEPGDVFVPRPAYFAYRQAASVLSGADYFGSLEGQPEPVEGYRFRKNAETIIVVWSDTAQETLIPAPAGVEVSCSERDGGSFACANSDGGVRLTVRSDPIYITYTNST